MTRFLISICFVLAIMLRGGVPAAAQDEAPVVLYLKTNLPEALVYTDSLYLGRANQHAFTIPADRKELRLVAPDLASWSVQAITADIEAGPGDTLTLTVDFPYYYQIESVPFDARVFLEQPQARTLLGETPLVYTSTEPLRGMIFVTKDGYIAERFTPGEEIWNFHRTVLTREEIEEAIAEGHWKPEGKSRKWLAIAAGGVSLASGIAAVAFKAKADRRYDRYVLTGDPTLRGGFERYDRYAAISLGAMQVGIGVLAIRLVLD